MQSAIRLSVECKFPALPKEDFFGIRILGIAPHEAVAYYEYGGMDGRCVLVHLHDGVAEQHELQVGLALLLDGPGEKRRPVLMKVGQRLLLLVNLHLLYEVDTDLRLLSQIVITNDLPQVKRLRRSVLYADEQPGFSDTNAVPVFFPGNWIAPRAIQFMALLRIQTDDNRAEWLDCGGHYLFDFRHSDFPATLLGDEAPLIHDAVCRNGTIQIYTIGNSSSYIKYGMTYYGLATFDRDRRLVETPLMDCAPPHDPKKHGRLGKFTSSLKYCIITPLFTTSDAWKRKQCLFDLDEKRLHEVVLPRGLSKFNVVEHAHDTFWLLSTDSRDHFEIVSCSQS